MIFKSFRMALAEQTLHPGHANFGPWHSAFQDHLRSSLSRLQRFVLNLSKLRQLDIRNQFASQLKGTGVEIGAQHIPTKVQAATTVEYVDVLSNEQLISRYGLSPHGGLVPLTHVIDGHKLSPYADGSRDFLIANHVLEHFDDPVSGVVEWVRILRNGGLLFLTLPNFRGNAFDYKRRPERAAHFRLDYTDPANRDARNREHYEDLAMHLVSQARTSEEVQALVTQWLNQGDRHHYHVYDEAALKDVLSVAAEISGNDLELVDALLPKYGFELLVVVRKLPAKGSKGRLSWLPNIVNSARAAQVFTRAAFQEIKAKR